MPYATVHCNATSQNLAAAIASDLAKLLKDRTKSPATADVIVADRRFVEVPMASPANRDIVVAILHHGGLLLTEADVEHLGREITAKYPNWQMLFTSDVSHQWFANGSYA